MDFLHEAQEALWMGNDGISKSQNQRKKRQERNSCINNVKINHRSLHPSIDNNTYTKRHQKLQRGSLENVSSVPWGNPHESGTLRRSRSLAITRDDVFSSLDIREIDHKPRRAQLIPRAKLIERCKEPRYAVVKGSSVENLQRIRKELSISPPDYSPPRPAAPEAVYSSISNLASPKFIIGNQQENSEVIYQKQNNPECRVSYEEIPGLSLPNYYPDSKYDTDNTDAISLADDLSSFGDNLSKKYSSCDNISAGRWTIQEQESIPYDDNIVLSTNRPLYDSIKENHYAKPKTIRGPTPYNNEKPNFYRDKRRSYSSESSEDKTKDFEENDNISLEHFETDKNLDEINENITSIVEIIEKPEETQNNTKAEPEIIKTNIEVEAPPPDNEEYKTIVTVDPDLEETEEEKNKHSHNYLREFLESQKGSKKPLQNFITKKLSNLSRKSTNLIDNRFYSLPDLAVTKSLRKCEKIDRKLRKCEKTNIKKSESGESRFIVNIGKHFDITANSNIPVDFELKIAKVPRRKSKKSKHKPEEQFLEAVRNLKDTLNNKFEENYNLTKPEIIAVKSKMEECTKEYQERLGNMRTYWDKMLNVNDKVEEIPEDDENQKKSHPKCKIVDVQTKVEDVKKKFEPEEKEPEKPSKVQITKQFFERKPIEKIEKISPLIKETCNYFENTKNNHFNNNQYESLNPNIVEIVSKDDDNKHKPISKSMSITYPEFDHVRYRVVKSDLFQKKIFANCEKESQFDGLMQYLQNYSFQELLRDNNIVIIEPIRTKIPHETTNKKSQTTKNVTPLLHKRTEQEEAGSKRHFFYHPIRVNKEMNDDELPNPDTVKQVRQLFEGGLTRSQSSHEFEDENDKSSPKLNDPDKDHCSATDSNTSNNSECGSEENLFDSLTEHCCERQYVSEDVLEKIRECGTTVTYYGGRVVKKQSGQPVLTKAIMEEIKNNELRSIECNCKKNEKDIYQGVKFRLIKSNSCNSRLELVGTNDLKKSKEKYLNNRQKTLKEIQENQKEVKEIENKQVEKNIINESIKKNIEDTQPKIIGEERKMTQWGDVSKEKTYVGINFNNTSKPKIMYDYHYDNLKTKPKKIDDMEFEPYEVA